jgi:hypothetical protein
MEKREKREKTKHAITRCPSPRQRVDGVHRRTDSFNPTSDYMRHRVRRAGANVRLSARVRKPYSGFGRVLYKNNRPPTKQPPVPKIQSRSVATGRHSWPTRPRKPQTSSLRPSRGLGTLYQQRLHFPTFPSAQTGHQPGLCTGPWDPCEQIFQISTLLANGASPCFVIFRIIMTDDISSTR